MGYRPIMIVVAQTIGHFRFLCDIMPPATSFQSSSIQVIYTSTSIQCVIAAMASKQHGRHLAVTVVVAVHAAYHKSSGRVVQKSLIQRQSKVVALNVFIHFQSFQLISLVQKQAFSCSMQGLRAIRPFCLVSSAVSQCTFTNPGRSKGGLLLASGRSMKCLFKQPVAYPSCILCHVPATSLCEGKATFDILQFSSLTPDLAQTANRVRWLVDSVSDNCRKSHIERANTVDIHPS